MATQREADERRLAWDERHRGGDFEGRGPNPSLKLALEGVEPGRALELACGSGTNAVWLAGQGWRTTAVDWSEVGLANGQVKAQEAGVAVEWLQRDLFEWKPEPRSFDLVAIVYLHLPIEERWPVYTQAAAAVASGGRMVVVGHDPQQALEGQPGPDPDRLIAAAQMGAELCARDPELWIERADTIRQAPLPDRGPIDALLVLRRKP
jgi:SAM-dependent methyltransferase